MCLPNQLATILHNTKWQPPFLLRVGVFCFCFSPQSLTRTLSLILSLINPFIFQATILSTLTLNTLLINVIIIQWKENTSKWSSGHFTFDRISDFLSFTYIIFKNGCNKSYLTGLLRGLNLITSYDSWSSMECILGTE